jgi:gliding motility-associated-like protein
MKNLTKKIIAGIFAISVFSGIASAQCSFDFDIEVVQHSTCLANGIVKVRSSDGSIDLSEEMFISLTSSSINEMSSENGHSFGSLPPGEYTVTFLAVCKGTQNTVNKSKKVTVLSQYDAFGASMASTKRSSLNCMHSGKVSIDIRDGRLPYKIEITSKPDDYTGQTVFETSDQRYDIEHLAPGDYVFTVSDACSSSKPLSATINKLDSDFPANPYENLFRPSSCSQAYVYENSGGSNEYWDYYREMYEVAFTFDDTRNWSSYFPYTQYIDLPKSYKELHAEGAKMKVYLRLKDTECTEAFAGEIQFSDPPEYKINQYSEKSCGNYKLSFNLNYEYLMCQPFTWEIFDASNNLIDSRTGLDYFGTRSAENLLYGESYTIKVTDNSGTVVTSDAIIYNPDTPGGWYWISEDNYTYDFNYTNYGLCMPYTLEIYDDNNNLIKSYEDLTDPSGIIEDLEYGRKYFFKMFDSFGNEIPFEYEGSAPQRYVSWHFGGNGGDGEGEWSCENYSAAITPVNLNIPYTWIIMDKDRNELSKGSVEDNGNSVLPGLLYNFEYIIEFTDGIETVTQNIYQTEVSPPNPVIHSYWDYDYTCEDYEFRFEVGNIYCFPYKWEIFDSDGNPVPGLPAHEDLNTFDVYTVRLQYDMWYTIRVTDSKGKYAEIAWHRANNDVAPYIDWWSIEDYDLQCYDYGHKFNVSNIHCFPYKWEVYEKDNNVPVDSQTDIYELGEHNTRLEYNKDYTVIITDDRGRKYEYPRRRDKQSSSVNFYKYSDMSNCISDSYAGYIELSGPFEDGVSVHFVSGPQTPLHADIVLDESTYYFYPFSEDYRYYEYVVIAEGDYVFEITDKCGVVHTLDVSHKRYMTVEDFTYTKDEITDVCNGITRIYPTGKVYNNGWLYSPSYFTMIKSPVPDLVGLTISEGEYFSFTRTGRYVIEIKSSWWGCGLDTIAIDYVSNALDLGGRSSYVCETGTIGHIRVQAIKGKAPYTYTLMYEDGVTPVEGVPSNTTGEFEYGAYKEKYSVKIQDACPDPASINIPVEINTLDQTALLYGNAHILRGETIDLSCLILGATEYKWSGPLDFSNDERTVLIPNSTVGHSGEYTVQVKPAGCDKFFEGSITVEVHDPPAPEELDIPLCQADGDYQLSAEPLNEEYHIRWYDKDGQFLPEAPLVDLRNFAEHTFYITQVETAFSYESDRAKLTVTVNPLPEKNASASGWGCEDGRTEITVTDMIPKHIYTVFTDAAATNSIHTFVGTSDNEISQTLPVKITENTDYYLQVATEKGCILPPAVVTVLRGVFSGIVSADRTVCYNTAPQTLTSTPPTGGTGVYEYRWQQKNDDGTWSEVESGTGASYSPDALTGTTVYRLKTVGGANPCDTVFSNEVTVTVLPPFAPGSIAASQTITSGQTPDELTSVPASGGSGEYSYQWQYSLNGNNWTDIAGAGGETYSPPSPVAPVLYRRKVTDGVCDPAYSDTVAIAPLSLLSQKYIACENAVVQIGVGAATGITYYWYDAETGGTLVSGGAPEDSILTYTKNAAPVQTLWLEPRYGNLVLPRHAMELILGDNCGATDPTGCAVNGTVVFREDFGGNSPDDPETRPAGIPQVIGYDYRNDPRCSGNNGCYSIRKYGQYNNTSWYQPDDHTYPDDLSRGYMLEVDASGYRGQFYEHTLDNLCTEAKLYFSLWLVSLITDNRHPDHTNLVFLLEDSQGNLLAQYYTGNVPDGDSNWKHYGFLFTVPQGISALTLKVISNSTGGSGNDFAMDDIEIRLCAPPVTAMQSMKTDTTVCTGTPFTFSGSYTDDGTFGNSLVYRWEYNASGDLNSPDNWHAVEGTEGASAGGSVQSVYDIASVEALNTGDYRLVIANPDNIGNYNCRAMSEIIHLQVNEIVLLSGRLPVYRHDEPYSVQLESNAEEAIYTTVDELVPGISLSPSGLVSGTVPESAGFVESTFTVTVTDKYGCSASREYTLQSCGPAPKTPRPDIQYCEGSQASALEALASEGLRLQWYDAEMNALPGAPAPRTDILDEQVFYVSQVNEELLCESEKTEIRVNITPLAKPDINAPDVSICYGDSPVVSLSNLYSSFTYNMYANIEMTELLASLSGETSGELSLTTVPESSTSYYILITDDLGCVSKEFAEVKINVIKPDILPERLPAYKHDIPYSVQLESNAEEPAFSIAGDLMPGMSFFSPEGIISGTVPESAGFVESLFTVTVTDKNGCTADREYTFSGCVLAPETPHADVSYCNGAQSSALEVSALEGLLPQWYDAEMNALPEAPSPSTATVDEQVFYVSQISEALQCESDKAEIRVKITPLPAIDFIASARDACYEGSPAILLEGVRETYSYSVYSDRTFSVALGSLTEATSGTVIPDGAITESTAYYILVTDSIGCTSTDWLEVRAGVIKLYIEPEKLSPYIKNTEYEQQLVSNAQSPVFTLVDGSLPEGLVLNASGLISGSVPGAYRDLSNIVSIEVRDLNGCSTVREYALNGNIFVPKAFTPNGDGINDIFMPGNKLVILDRLGIEIFRGDNGWDGTYKGKPVAEDIYFYTLEYTDPDSGITKAVTGYVGVHY